MTEQEQLEATVWGQSVKVAAGSILPMLLIGLLALDAWLLHTQTQIMEQATNAAAQFVIQEVHAHLDREIQGMRALHHERGREHDNILKRMNETIEMQNNLFAQTLSTKSIQDTKQHGAIERAIVRACRAKEEELTK